MKTNIQTLMITTVGVLVLSACGGGGSKKAPVVSTDTKVEKCSSTNITTLKKDDKVTALTDSTQVRITHTQDGTKVACVISGDAKVN